MQNRPYARPRRRRPSRAVILRRRLVVFVAAPVIIGLLIFAAVSASSGPGPKPPPPAVAAKQASTPLLTRIDVGIRTYEYVDSSRHTYDYTTGQVLAGRHIGVELFYPTHAGTAGTDDPGAALAARHAYPLIVFAPGYRLRAEDYRALLDAWVRDGYLVAALQFPDTTYPQSDAPYRAGLPHGVPEGDLYNEPGDVAFALAHLLQASAAKSGWLSGLVDRQRVVLAGHSDGAVAVAALAYDRADQVQGLHVRAVAALSGGELPISNQVYGQPSPAIPLLVVQSATDTCNPPWTAVQLYNALGAPKYFLELDAASHLGAYDGAQAAPFTVVERATAAFFASALDARGASISSLAAAAQKSGVSSFTDVSVAGAIPTPSAPTSCPSD